MKSFPPGYQTAQSISRRRNSVVIDREEQGELVYRISGKLLYRARRRLTRHDRSNTLRFQIRFQFSILMQI